MLKIRKREKKATTYEKDITQRYLNLLVEVAHMKMKEIADIRQAVSEIRQEVLLEREKMLATQRTVAEILERKE